jgi:UDP-4-amino-4,6-dideoxy-N-acetyl-beta-L-altrosamine transaminase/dTDP-4-dehydrorhamnose reductase
MANNNYKMFITGVSGLLGNNLAGYFKDKYEILGLYSSHPVAIKGIITEKCDISDDSLLRKIIKQFCPYVIIHCASLTNIDQCETDRSLTRRVNVLSNKNIIDAISGMDANLIYISTDAVYDGIKGNFSENNTVNPLNYYGLSKYEGELEVLKKENSLVLRTNIFGWNIQDKKSLGEWILEELMAGRRINCFADAYFSSIYTIELSRVIDIAIQNNLSGIYNCGATNSCSKYEFACKIASCFGFDKTLIAPISIDDFDFKAKRGKKLTLNVNKLQKGLDYKLPTIEQSIESFYKDYKCGLPDMIKKGQSTSRQEFNFIPYGRHWIDENDIQAVASVLRSDRITQGPKVEEFEKALSEYTGARYAVVVSSGTAALHIACLAANVKEGDEVITSPITFVASANCVVYCGAKPVFADIDSRTYNIDPQEIERKITQRTKVIIPVHFAGQSCEMEQIYKLSKKYNFTIIEDACHAIGGSYNDIKIGSCNFSDMAVFSFHPVKTITTGEGGMVLTNRSDLYDKLIRLRTHGITRNSHLMTDKSHGPWYYQQIDLGMNYRITDIQAAMGLSQLRRIDMFVSRRHELAQRYNEALSDLPLILPWQHPDAYSSFHLYVIRLKLDKINKTRGEVFEKLHHKGIGVNVHYIPVHTQPFYTRLGFFKGQFPEAEKYYEEAITLPLFPSMTDKEQDRVIQALEEVLS